MESDILLLKIARKIKKTPFDIVPYEDYFSYLLGEELDLNTRLAQSKWLRGKIKETIKTGKEIDIARFIKLSNKTLLFEAPYFFDSYMQYLEINRNPKDKFYLPRKPQLKEIVDTIQDLTDDKLDEAFISLPPRTGKTTLVMFYMTWLIGKDSERSNLYSAFSDVITSAFYNGVLEIINDDVTYTWKTIFPDRKVVGTNAKDETLNIDRRKRYPSLTCRSLYGTLNGACDCNGVLVSDDLIGGIEEALNQDRMVSAWSKVDNNLLSRAKERAKILWVGTRWSLIDPIGRRADLVLNDDNFKGKRVKFINRPALDLVTDESNFNYKYGVGYTTEKFKERRASFERNNDIASWQAQYQQEPIERTGALFLPEDMLYYNGELPVGEADRIFMPVDVAFGGGDYVSAPVCYQYGENCYVHDVVFDNGDKKITEPRIVDLITRNNVHEARFEANNGGEGYKEDVERELRKRAYRLNITAKMADNTKRKEARIFEKAPEIREFYFRENGKRSKDYSLFMQNIFAFKVMGKNKNEDAPDSMAMAADMKNGRKAKIEILPRPF